MATAPLPNEQQEEDASELVFPKGILILKRVSLKDGALQNLLIYNLYRHVVYYSLHLSNSVLILEICYILHTCTCHHSAVATLQGHLWSNVSSKFHKNMGILKPISRNRDMGCFLPEISWNPPKRGIFWHCNLSFLEICQLSSVSYVIVQYTMMLERVFLK